MKINEFVRRLEGQYGIPKRRRSNPLECLILTILSQNTNDLNRDKAYLSMKERFPSWENVLDARERELADSIRVGGLAKVKSKRIKEILKSIKKDHGKFDLSFLREKSTEEVEKILSSYNGVGLKTAKIVLLFALGRDVFPVDTHIHRLSKRMGFVPPGATREKTHEIMGELVPKKKMYSFHINLIRHGREVCTARKPGCSQCILGSICPKII